MKGGHPLWKFRASKVTFIPPDDSWIIRGWASFEGDPKEHGHLANITANWRDSRWYLSPVAFALVGGGLAIRFTSPSPTNRDWFATRRVASADEPACS